MFSPWMTSNTYFSVRCLIDTWHASDRTQQRNAWSLCFEYHTGSCVVPITHFLFCSTWLVFQNPFTHTNCNGRFSFTMVITCQSVYVWFYIMQNQIRSVYCNLPHEKQLNLDEGWNIFIVLLHAYMYTKLILLFLATELIASTIEMSSSG